jgi:hypothetical protein
VAKSGLRKKSAYAEKQGRARKSAGDDHDGPRTRYAKTSPLSSEYVVNGGHRLAEYFARGEQLERERLQRRASFDGAEVYYGGRRVPGRARVVLPRVALP